MTSRRDDGGISSIISPLYHRVYTLTSVNCPFLVISRRDDGGISSIISPLYHRVYTLTSVNILVILCMRVSEKLLKPNCHFLKLTRN